MIVKYDKVNSMDWLLTTAYSEGKFAENVIKDESLWNLGEFKHLKFYELRENGEVVGRCMVHDEVGLDINGVYGFMIYPKFQNQGYGTKLFTHIIENYDIIKFSTRNENLIKIANKYNCILDKEIEDEYSDNEFINQYIVSKSELRFE